MKIKYESDVGILLDFKKVLEARGILPTDITEATFMVKNHAKDKDIDALIDLRLGDGLVWVQDDSTLTATITLPKWSKLTAGKIYAFGVGFKVVGSTRFTEPVLSDEVFHVVQDFIRG